MEISVLAGRSLVGRGSVRAGNNAPPPARTEPRPTKPREMA